MKSWDARATGEVVFKHDDNNLIPHQLFRSAKARQHSIAPASTGNVPPRLEYEAINEARFVGTNSLQGPAEPDVNQPIEIYSSASFHEEEEEEDIRRRFPGLTQRPKIVTRDGILRR